MARTKTPYFPFYADEYLNDPAVQSLDCIEEGCFIRLLANLWLAPLRGVFCYPSGYRISTVKIPSIYLQPRLSTTQGIENPAQRAVEIFQKLLEVGLIREGKAGVFYNKRMLLYLSENQRKNMTALQIEGFEREKWRLVNEPDFLTVFLRLKDGNFTVKNGNFTVKKRGKNALEGEGEGDIKNKDKNLLSEPKTFSDEVGNLTNLLISKILTNDPKAKCPPLSENGQGDGRWVRWAIQADLLFRVDLREPREAEQLIHWCQAHHFWKTNILSMGKFREQYPQLRLRWKAEQGWKPEENETAEQRMARLKD